MDPNGKWYLPTDLILLVCEYFDLLRDVRSLGWTSKHYYTRLLRDIRSPDNHRAYHLLCNFVDYGVWTEPHRPRTVHFGSCLISLSIQHPANWERHGAEVSFELTDALEAYLKKDGTLGEVQYTETKVSAEKFRCILDEVVRHNITVINSNFNHWGWGSRSLAQRELTQISNTQRSNIQLTEEWERWEGLKKGKLIRTWRGTYRKLSNLNIQINHEEHSYFSFKSRYWQRWKLIDSDDQREILSFAKEEDWDPLTGIQTYAACTFEQPTTRASWQFLINMAPEIYETTSFSSLKQCFSGRFWQSPHITFTSMCVAVRWYPTGFVERVAERADLADQSKKYNRQDGTIRSHRTKTP